MTKQKQNQSNDSNNNNNINKSNFLKCQEVTILLVDSTHTT